MGFLTLHRFARQHARPLGEKDEATGSKDNDNMTRSNMIPSSKIRILKHDVLLSHR
jgi:hypothetical protein